MGPGFSWMSPNRMMHTSVVHGGGVVGNPVELFDLRHFNFATVY